MSELRPDVRAEWYNGPEGTETRLFLQSAAAREVFEQAFAYTKHGDWYRADFQMMPAHFLNAHHGFGPDLSVEIQDCRL